MLSDQDIVAEFEALAQNYGLPKEGGPINKDGLDQWASNYIILQIMYVLRKKGEYFTDEEICGDFSALDIARMLKQLKKVEGQSKFSLVFGPYGEEYDSPSIIDVFSKSLTEALCMRVEKLPCLHSSTPNNPNKGKPVMLLGKGYGGGFTGRGFIIPYPEGVEPQEIGFSDQELDAIIAYEEPKKADWVKAQGNKERWEEKGSSRLPELGGVAIEISKLLPPEMGRVDQYNFIADFMRAAGFLDFKGGVWLSGFDGMDRSKRYATIKNWIRAKKY